MFVLNDLNNCECAKWISKKPFELQRRRNNVLGFEVFKEYKCLFFDMFNLCPVIKILIGNCISRPSQAQVPTLS
jgi:hypothetical protein